MLQWTVEQKVMKLLKFNYIKEFFHHLNNQPKKKRKKKTELKCFMFPKSKTRRTKILKRPQHKMYKIRVVLCNTDVRSVRGRGYDVSGSSLGTIRTWLPGINSSKKNPSIRWDWKKKNVCLSMSKYTFSIFATPCKGI